MQKRIFERLLNATNNKKKVVFKTQENMNTECTCIQQFLS